MPGIRARNLVRRARLRRLLDRDLRRLRRALGPVPPPPADGPVALIVSLTYFVYQLKLEGVLATALRSQGCVPVALVPPGSRLARRYFRSFGINRFVELSSYVDELIEERVRVESQLLVERRWSIAELKDFTYHGAAVGRFVLSTISRGLHEGHVDLDDGGPRRLLTDLLPVALRSTLAAEALLDDLRPGIVLFNERNYADQGPLSDVALDRGLNVVQFVSAFQDDALVFKRYTKETRGLHPRSLSDESWERVARMPWGEEQERGLDEEFRQRYDSTWGLSRRIQGWTRAHTREEIQAKLALDPAKRTAVVFSHVLWDANMFYGEDLFADQEEWFVETVRAACGNELVNWVIKLHPANVWKLQRDGASGELHELVTIRQHIGELPPHVKVLEPASEISTRSLFDVTDVGVTIRGSVGIELPCFGTPVLTAGTGFYSGRGFTLDPSSPADYLERLRTIESVERLTPAQVELARRHAYALFRLRPTRFASFRSTFRAFEEIGHPLEQDLDLCVGSIGELGLAEDIRGFGTWATRSRALDYLELPGAARTSI